MVVGRSDDDEVGDVVGQDHPRVTPALGHTLGAGRVVVRGPPLHPSWAGRDDINRGPPSAALSTPSAPPQTAHCRPPLLPNCPNNLPGNAANLPRTNNVVTHPPRAPHSVIQASLAVSDENESLCEKCNLSWLSPLLHLPFPSSQSSTQYLSPLPILHLHQLPARMEIHHGRRSRPTNGRAAGRRWRRQVAALIPTWRHLLGQGGNFRFCFCSDSVALCRLPRQLPIPPPLFW